MLEGTLQLESLLTWRTLVDVGLVAVLIYQLLLLLRGTRSAAVLLAVALLFALFYLSQDSVLDLPTVNWMLDRFISSVVILLVVLFQDDLRRALASVIRSPLASFGRDASQSAVVAEVLRAASVLSQRGIGALMVIEREAPLDRYVEQGVRIDGRVGWQLLLSLFIPSHMNPTHDGAVVLSKGRVAAAACFLPLAQGDDLPAQLGSRHRAALGLADETDAVVVVVSEETGQCGLAHLGQLDIDLKPAELRERLRAIMGDDDDPRRRERRWRRRIVPHGSSGKATRVTGEFSFESLRARRPSRPATEPVEVVDLSLSQEEREPSPSPVERVAQLAVITAEHVPPTPDASSEKEAS